MIHEWKLTFMDSLCTCVLRVSTGSIWDPSTSWVPCKRTTKLSAVSCNLSAVIPSAGASISACKTWIVCRLMRYTWSLRCPQRKQSQQLMSGDHGGQDHQQTQRSGNRYQKHDSGRLRRHTLYWACTILLEKCCVHMPCSLNDRNYIHIILQLLQVQLFVTVPFKATGPTGPCLTISHHMVHSVRWSDVSTTLCWTFRSSQPRVLSVHYPTEVEMSFITKP
jgi:hypothetical protein